MRVGRADHGELAGTGADVGGVNVTMVLKTPQSFIGAATAGRGSACIGPPTSTLPLTTRLVVAVGTAPAGAAGIGTARML